MDVSSHLSNIMLKCGGFEKHEDRLPATLIDPQLLHVSSMSLSKSGSFKGSSLRDAEYAHNILDDELYDDSLASFEDGPLDCVTTEDGICTLTRVFPLLLFSVYLMYYYKLATWRF